MKNKKKIFLGFVRFMIVLIVSIYIFKQIPLPKINSEELIKLQAVNKTELIIPQSIPLNITYPQNFEELIWRILFANSKPDKICFENIGTFIQFGDGTLSDNIEVEINYNEDKQLRVERIACFKINAFQSQFTFQWGFHTKIAANEILKKGGFILHPDVKTYVVLGGLLDRLVMFICTFLFTGSLFWLWKGCFDFVMKGWLK